MGGMKPKPNQKQKRDRQQRHNNLSIHQQSVIAAKNFKEQKNILKPGDVGRGAPFRIQGRRRRL